MASELPPLSDDTVDMSGPTPTSNWVVPGRLIAGAYPGSPEPEEHRKQIKNLIHAGVTTFVCLMESEERERMRFVPYEDIAAEFAREQGRTLKFVSFPIPDMYIADSSQLLEIIPKIRDIVRDQDQCVYVHCWGGHGRTGIIIAILLAMLYEIDVERALNLTECYHSKRIVHKSHSPQTQAQCDQVRSIVRALREDCKGKDKLIR